MPSNRAGGGGRGGPVSIPYLSALRAQPGSSTSHYQPVGTDHLLNAEANQPSATLLTGLNNLLVTKEFPSLLAQIVSVLALALGLGNQSPRSWLFDLLLPE